jgi:hypothetical protein
MDINAPPRPYPEWRTAPGDRAEDAAYAFGYPLIIHCRDEAMKTIPEDASPETKAAVEKAVDVALHNVCDMFDGYWPLDAGPKHQIQLSLIVKVFDETKEVEQQEISSSLDLAMGYWKWSGEREFR